MFFRDGEFDWSREQIAECQMTYLRDTKKGADYHFLEKGLDIYAAVNGFVRGWWLKKQLVTKLWREKRWQKRTINIFRQYGT